MNEAAKKTNWTDELELLMCGADDIAGVIRLVKNEMCQGKEKYDHAVDAESRSLAARNILLIVLGFTPLLSMLQNYAENHADAVREAWNACDWERMAAKRAEMQTAEV